MKKRRAIWGAAILAGVLVLGMWWVAHRHTATPEVIEGWASPNANGTAIGLAPSNEGYIIAGAQWSGPDDSWHDGATLPNCLGMDTTVSKHVQLGVIDIDTDLPHRRQVVWMKCLE
ncbi:hypothetical protein [Amycolatopsis sp. NPDC059657]|uniref:hypothetical protein n=1 Tax=Amycolatopsis sp. NPDC059657 TaxID=3346899 RepID=UPI00366CFF1F